MKASMLLQNRNIVHKIAREDDWGYYAPCGAAGPLLTTITDPDPDYYHAYSGKKAPWRLCKKCFSNLK